jgi:VIT1/CCC1 family predicted Fe2+/Mn2+ transporter
VSFAIAVFGGVLGGLLLLLKKSAAFYVFIASLLGAFGAQLPFLGMVLGKTGFPIEALVGGLMQLLVGALLVWYSRWAESKGWVG